MDIITSLESTFLILWMYLPSTWVCNSKIPGMYPENPLQVLCKWVAWRW